MLDTFVVPGVSTLEGPAIPTPEITVQASDETYGRVAVGPLERGFAQTIGNPLRRILLSSTPGTAVTWVKITDVVHEYMAIPGVKEEVMEILLNIKGIRIRSATGRDGKMRLEVNGGGPVCAGDIMTSSDFEIVNPEQHLATLDDDHVQLSIEFNVRQGTGYQTAQPGEDGSSIPAGALPVDAVFSPVRKVNFSVERTRVGQITDYERLILEVWTDGAIHPIEAVQSAAEKLVQNFFLFSKLTRAVEHGPDRIPLVVSPEVYQTPIESLQLSPRTLNCLKRAQINRVGEVLEMADDDLLKIRNFGEKSLDELKEKLAEHGITSPRRDSEEAEDTDGAGAFSADALSELMGGGDEGKSSDLPVGMTFDDEGLLASAGGDNDGEPQFEEYD
jgi:DNA-directed RNA polymerase subunit alpha